MRSTGSPRTIQPSRTGLRPRRFWRESIDPSRARPGPNFELVDHTWTHGSVAFANVALKGVGEIALQGYESDADAVARFDRAIGLAVVAREGIDLALALHHHAAKRHKADVS